MGWALHCISHKPAYLRREMQESSVLVPMHTAIPHINRILAMHAAKLRGCSFGRG
jgi:hypothetical protein